VQQDLDKQFKILISTFFLLIFQNILHQATILFNKIQTKMFDVNNSNKKKLIFKFKRYIYKIEKAKSEVLVHRKTN